MMLLLPNNTRVSVVLLVVVSVTHLMHCCTSFAFSKSSFGSPHYGTTVARSPAPVPVLRSETNSDAASRNSLAGPLIMVSKDVSVDVECDLCNIPVSAMRGINDPNDQRYSAKDWFHNVKSLPRSSILREIHTPVLAVMAWSFAITLIHKSFLLMGKANWATKMCISAKPHSFLVSALGLLLVFRTNTAYQRFAEGRQIWEKILSISRNTSRMVSLYECDFGVERKQRIMRLLGAFPYLLRDQLHDHLWDNKQRRAGDHKPRRRNIDYDSLPWCLLPPLAQQKCSESVNRPLWICDRLGQEIVSVKYSPNYTSRERLKLLSDIGQLTKCIGECERIHQTAVPLNYARHSLRSLTLWLFSLPLALIQELGWLTSPVMGATAWLLFGVYQIGYTIEDPFQGSLRLKSLCDAIYRDVMYSAENMHSHRDSAYDLELDESELNEWDKIEIKQESKPKLPTVIIKKAAPLPVEQKIISSNTSEVMAP